MKIRVSKAEKQKAKMLSSLGDALLSGRTWWVIASAMGGIFEPTSWILGEGLHSY